MNAYQIEKCARILNRKGFDEQQDKLVDELDSLITAAQGDDYDPFITALANVRIMVEQMRISLTKDQQKIYYSRLNAEIERQIRETGGMYGRTVRRTSCCQRIRKNGVFVIINGKKVWFKNDETVSHIGKEVYVKYDPENINEVKVYDKETDEFLWTYQQTDTI